MGAPATPVRAPRAASPRRAAFPRRLCRLPCRPPTLPSPSLAPPRQGIVWGTNTPLTAMDERLCNRFDYDGEYGTVLNRFLMQVSARSFSSKLTHNRIMPHAHGTRRWLPVAAARPLLCAPLHSLAVVLPTNVCDTSPPLMAPPLTPRALLTGGLRYSADRLRHRWPDPRLHPHRRHVPVHRARVQQPAERGRSRRDPQPGRPDRSRA